MTNIPTLRDLYLDIIADLEAEFAVTLPLVGKNFLRVMAAVQAAKLKIYYLAVADLQRNIFVDTAKPESRGGTLERFGRVKLGRNPFAATAGYYELKVTGEIGSTIQASTTFKSNDDSLNPDKLFVLDDAFTLATTPGYITVRALEAGTDSQLNVLDELTSTAPIAGVNSLAVVESEVTAPLAAEDTEDYREKVISSFRTETQGGAATDFRQWSLDAQGVVNSYPYTNSGNSATVDLYVEASEADSTDGYGTPSPTILAAVEEVIERNPDDTLDISERGRRPMGVKQVNYLPVTPLAVNITINGFVDITGALQASILAEVKSKLSKIRPFVAAADVYAEKNDTLDINKLILIIYSVNANSVFDSIELSVDGSVVNSFTFTDGYIPYVDTITYV